MLIVDQANMVTSYAISESSTNYGKNVTGSYYVDNANEDSDSEEGDVCKSEDEVLRTVG